MPSFVPASPPSLAAFVALLAFVVGALLTAVRYAWRSPARTALAAGLLAAWLGGLSALVATGRLEALPLGGLPFFFGQVALVALGVGLSPVGRRLAATLPLAGLVAFQGFRLPLELVLHAWARGGTIPETMTWSGQNLDVASGALALVCAPLATRHRGAAWLANVVGIVLLANVVRVAVLSPPVPFGWRLEAPLRLAYHLPYRSSAPCAWAARSSGTSCSPAR